MPTLIHGVQCARGVPALWFNGLLRHLPASGLVRGARWLTALPVMHEDRPNRDLLAFARS